MYLMDANTCIQAQNVHYSMDFCPAYWDWLESQFNLGKVAGIDQVYTELTGRNDPLSVWIKDRSHHFLEDSDENTQQAFSKVAEWVACQPIYNPTYKESFLSGADPWLVAKALSSGATIVTQEKRVPDDSTKVKIPNVCEAFGVKYINTFEALRILQATFVLQAK